MNSLDKLIHDEFMEYYISPKIHNLSKSLDIANFELNNWQNEYKRISKFVKYMFEVYKDYQYDDIISYRHTLNTYMLEWAKSNKEDWIAWLSKEIATEIVENLSRYKKD